MKLSFYSVIFFLVFSCPQAYAIKVDGLYQSSVPVENESAQLRKIALKQALTNVLIKLTGDRDIPNNTNVDDILQRPERFVQQFRYKEIETEADADVAQMQLALQVKFDETLLNEVMRSYGLSIWGNERPAILVWLVNEDSNIRRIVSFEESPELISVVDKRAFERGITLLFPLLDLEDTSQISVSDLWGVFKQPIITASSRYQADAILVGKVQQPLTGKWQANWTLINTEDTQDWQTDGQDADQALGAGIDELVDRLAARYANFASTRAELISVEVENVTSIDDYAKVLSYLESLQSVTSVLVKNVMPERVSFEVIIHGGVDVLNQAVSLSNLLQNLDDVQTNRYRLITN